MSFPFTAPPIRSALARPGQEASLRTAPARLHALALVTGDWRLATWRWAISWLAADLAGWIRAVLSSAGPSWQVGHRPGLQHSGNPAAFSPALSVPCGRQSIRSA